MSRGLQAGIIATLFVAAALVLLGVIVADWSAKRVVQVKGTVAPVVAGNGDTAVPSPAGRAS
ncbi:hypothetical protein FHP25_20255 [Vineibacter terrae]|uniref:Uncharacterized protein n=1 Tax=Vineibacter terrae TaxID=2586908 RepID=A0A5C8PIV1_9HYPH|nr:hypothetical protein [Vineibacter terrae]TXL73741.1 hypothetical protein FHP25_20255 [Vineibacter terrae]